MWTYQLIKKSEIIAILCVRGSPCDKANNMIDHIQLIAVLRVFGNPQLLSVILGQFFLKNDPISHQKLFKHISNSVWRQKSAKVRIIDISVYSLVFPLLCPFTMYSVLFFCIFIHFKANVLKLTPTCILGHQQLWPAVQIANFYFIPLHHRWVNAFRPHYPHSFLNCTWKKVFFWDSFALQHPALASLTWMNFKNDVLGQNLITELPCSVFKN